MVTNTMSAMTFLLQLDSAWDYFINLSGCDYPMVTPQQQRRLLALRRERPLFFYLFGTNHWERFYQSRVGIIHVDPAVSFSTNSTTLFSFHHYRHTTFRSPLLDYVSHKQTIILQFFFPFRAYLRLSSFNFVIPRHVLSPSSK